jgi:large subunit ribosomal protein L9
MPRRRSGNQNTVTGTTKTSVEVLLAEKVPQLGEQGEVVRVKPGYARNYLLPQGLATIASEHNKRMVEQHRQRLEELHVSRLKGLRRQAEAIGKYSVTLEANANKEGHLYGSIVAVDISKALQAASFDVEPEHIQLEGPLKELGMYTVKVTLHAKVETAVKVWVVPVTAATTTS